jgi:hypothetical protein
LADLMSDEASQLKARLRRWTLLLGVLQITVGCVVGFTPPSAVPWFRRIVMAHIEYTANGVLMVASGFLVQEPRLGPGVLKAWFAILLPTTAMGPFCRRDWPPAVRGSLFVEPCRFGAGGEAQ